MNTSPAPPRVFLICEPSVKKARRAGGTLPNMVPLFEHGKVITLLTSQDPRPIDDPTGTLQLLDQRLDEHGFDPDRDHLAWAGGDTVAAFLLGVIVEARGLDAVSWLRYDRGYTTDGRRTDDGAHYVPVSLPLFIP